MEVHNFSTVRELAKDYEVIVHPMSPQSYRLFVAVLCDLQTRHDGAVHCWGDNLNMPFVGQLLRGGGAFFIRRTFRGNGLYTTVFKEYLFSILSRNTPLEYFIEGGRSCIQAVCYPLKRACLAMTTSQSLTWSC